MSDGYFIGLGDKTTCGGKVLDGDPRINLYGLLHTCEGDRVTCGKNGETYKILGGISHIESHGRLMAGTLDSFSSCPCQAKLIPSVYTATYSNEGYPLQPTRRAAQPAPPTQTSRSVAPQQFSYTPPGNPAPVTFTSVQGQEPGFFVVPQSMTREALEATLFPVRNPAVMRKFQVLNPDVGDVKAGSMIVLSDPNNASCTYQEAQLMQAAQHVEASLDPLTPDEADVLHRHGAEIAAVLCRSPALARPVGCAFAEFNPAAWPNYFGRSPQAENGARHFQPKSGASLGQSRSAGADSGVCHSCGCDQSCCQVHEGGWLYWDWYWRCIVSAGYSAGV